jgi:hypothetical protein
VKHWSIVCVALVAVMASANQAHAGRRARRAVRTTAIVAAATGGAAVVAARPRRSAVVVAAAPVPVVVAAAAPVAVAVPAALPDLTVINVAAELDVLCITVRNIGTAASPETRLQLDLAQLSDDASLGGALCRVPPLAVGQSVRIRLRSAPFLGMQATAFVDPAQQVAELDELNNDLAASFVAPEPVAEPPVLEAEAVWGAVE